MTNQDELGDPSENLANLVRSNDKVVFSDRNLLKPSRIVKGDRIVGRDSQMRQMVDLLKPLMQGSSPPNILAYGPSGTGKSLITNRVVQEYQSALTERDKELAFIKINCQWLNSVHQAGKKIIESVENLDNVDDEFTINGKATHHVFTTAFDAIKENYDAAIFLVDEIDLLVNPNLGPDDEAAYSSLLYILTRIEDLVGFEQTTVIAITNYPDFMHDVDGRAESTYNPRDILFSDYNGNQLREILQKREDAFNDEVLTNDVIPLSAAFAARDNGDARKAVDLLRTAGDLAIEGDSATVTEEHVRKAQKEVQRDRVLEIVGGSAKSKQLVLLSTALIQSWSASNRESVPNPVLENIYATVFNLINPDKKPKSNDTILRYMSEYEINGIVSSSRTGKGKAQGMYKKYVFNRPANLVIDTLTDEEEDFEQLLNSDNSDFLRDRISKKLSEFYNN